MPIVHPAAILAFLTAALAPAGGAGGQATPELGAGLPPLIWRLTAIADGATQTAPDDPARYTVQFGAGGVVLVRADCNRGRGTFEVDGARLTIGPVATTEEACPPGSLGSEFARRLGAVTAYAYDGADLVLTLGDDAGSLRFAPSLEGVVWEWQAFEGGDGSAIAPDDPARYTLEFLPGGEVAIGADCNRGRGTYSGDGDRLDLEVAAVTRAACPPGSLADRYLRDLDEVVSHVFAEGRLALALPADAGILSFAARVVEDAATPGAASTPSAGRPRREGTA